MNHDPSLVILSTSIAVLGYFTACVMTSGLASVSPSEVKLRLSMAALALGGSIWTMQFVGLLSLDAPVDWARNPPLLALSALSSFSTAAVSLFFLRKGKPGGPARWPLAALILGLGLSATHYLGLASLAGPALRLSWFLTVVHAAFSIQVAGLALWFFFHKRGVATTFAGAVIIGLGLAATHYLAVASAISLGTAIAAFPSSLGAVSSQYLAWSATVMMYLICSICLCVFVIMQFREEIE